MDKHKRAILFQLEPELAGPLRAALSATPLQVETDACEDGAQLAEMDAHWIFTGNLNALEQAIGPAADAGAKVVVVSRLADTRTYLDVMERGAHDYCTVPFDRAHLAWVLQSKEKGE